MPNISNDNIMVAVCFLLVVVGGGGGGMGLCEQTIKVSSLMLYPTFNPYNKPCTCSYVRIPSALWLTSGILGLLRWQNTNEPNETAPSAYFRPEKLCRDI